MKPQMRNFLALILFFGPFEATRHSEIVELVHKNGHVRLGNDPVVITRLTAVVEEDFQWNKV
jgi:hypothetical protein